MGFKAGDNVEHKHSGFEGVVIARASGSWMEYYEFPRRRNIPVVAVLHGHGEVRFFDADELSLKDS